MRIYETSLPTMEEATTVLNANTSQLVSKINCFLQVLLHSEGSEESTDERVTSAVSVNNLVLVECRHFNLHLFFLLSDMVVSEDFIVPTPS